MIQYRVPAGFGEAELIEKRSRFISRIWPAETEDEAIARIREMREKHWDASHNVYAYIIRDGNIMRYSDDGEPQLIRPIRTGAKRAYLSRCYGRGYRFRRRRYDNGGHSRGQSRSAARQYHGDNGRQRGHGNHRLTVSNCKGHIGRLGRYNHLYTKKYRS